jgi:toxin ParE1/3/4
MRVAYQWPAAQRDIVEYYVCLEEKAGEAVADRFLASLQGTCHQLAQDSGLGMPLALRAPALAGLRKWRVREFTNVLIFYLPRPEGVSIVRVLHAQQNWRDLLGIDG